MILHKVVVAHSVTSTATILAFADVINAKDPVAAGPQISEGARVAKAELPEPLAPCWPKGMVTLALQAESRATL